MEFFDQFSDTLISTGKMVGEKAKDIADVTKLSYQIRALEQEIHETYQELGKVLYEANEAGEELPDESDVFEVIREKKEEVDELRAQIKIIKGVEICPFCGKEIVKNAAFCPHCGEKID